MGYSSEKHDSSSSNPEDDQQNLSYSYATEIVNSSVMPMAMEAAIQLELFEIIAKAGANAKLSPKEIAANLPTNNPDAPSMLDRILRLLASYRIVGCTVASDEEGNPQRLYSLTPVSKFFVPDEDGFSLCTTMSLIQDKVYLESWSQLKDAIIEGGIPFNRVHGVHAFEYPARDPRFSKLFNTAMLNETIGVVKKMLESYRGFEQLDRVVDVGGGLGITLKLITSKYPFIKGINFDLPHVIKDAPPIPGVEHVGGDMFERIPEGDAIFMKWILHDWDDEHCLKVLKNCYDAIPDNGKVIVVDVVLPIAPEPTTFMRGTLQLDVLMMSQIPGGKERRKEEFQALATKAGFSGIRYECFICNYWVMEFFK